MPITLARLHELIDLAGSGGVEAIDMVEDGAHIRITRTGAAPIGRLAAAEKRHAGQAVAPAARDVLAAPMFGVLHLTPAPGAAPFVSVGDRVAKGQQLCLIEAMKMFHAFHSDREGALVAILAEAGDEIARGQPLFRIVEG